VSRVLGVACLYTRGGQVAYIYTVSVLVSLGYDGQVENLFLFQVQGIPQACASLVSTNCSSIAEPRKLVTLGKSRKKQGRSMKFLFFSNVLAVI
jgi:hypothetical protein